jgi:hypothetical protein
MDLVGRPGRPREVKYEHHLHNSGHAASVEGLLRRPSAGIGEDSRERHVSGLVRSGGGEPWGRWRPHVRRRLPGRGRAYSSRDCTEVCREQASRVAALVPFSASWVSIAWRSVQPCAWFAESASGRVTCSKTSAAAVGQPGPAGDRAQVDGGDVAGGFAAGCRARWCARPARRPHAKASGPTRSHRYNVTVEMARFRCKPGAPARHCPSADMIRQGEPAGCRPGRG